MPRQARRITDFERAGMRETITVHGHERDHGRRQGLLRELSLLRGRHAGRARPARAPHARGHAVPRPPRPRPVHPPHRRHPQGRRVRPALQPRHAAGRRVLLAHGRGPRRRACATTSASSRSTGRSPMQQRMDAASYLGVPLELSDGTRVGSLGALVARVLRLRARRRAAVRDARPRARLRARAREQRARPAPLQRHAARPGARDGRRRPRREGARRRRGRPHRRLRGRLRGRGRAGRVPARAERPRLHLDRDGRRRHRPGDDPAARRPDRPGPRVHRQGDLLRRRRAHAPGARRAARRGHRRPLRGLRARPARRRRRRRADRDLARAAGGAAGRARRRAAAARLPGRGRDRARRAARAPRRPLLHRPADRPRHAPHVRRGAPARARAHAPLRVAADRSP